MTTTTASTEKSGFIDDEFSRLPVVLESTYGMESDVSNALAGRYRSLLSPITNLKFRGRVMQDMKANKDSNVFQVSPPTPDEVCIERHDLVSRVIGVAATWLDLESKDSYISEMSYQVLLAQVNYASFIGCRCVFIQGPSKSSNSVRYASCVSRLLDEVALVHISIYLPMIEQDWRDDDLSAWSIWNTIRTVSDYSARLSVSLLMSASLPRDTVLTRWFSEPVAYFIVSSSIFISNIKKYPVLPKGHQLTLVKFFSRKIGVVLKDVDSPGNFEGGSASFVIYIQKLMSMRSEKSRMEEFAHGYEDSIRNMMQPLIEDLDLENYEMFEKDPVKYEQYANAIYAAIRDLAPKDSISVVIAGAGKGKIVECALRAAGQSYSRVKVIALEKSPNACIYLSQRNQSEWSGQVEVVEVDMRYWKPEQKADIIVSELLGGFGDNELSPECLDGIQDHLAPGGIMIPSSYSSFICPAMSHNIHCSVRTLDSLNKGACHTPYAAMLHSVDYLCKDVQKAWTFHHPAPFKTANNVHNVRQSLNVFNILEMGVVHGISGFFEAVLYKSVELSTNPQTEAIKCPNLISWFPIWFPLESPIFVPGNSEVEVSLWRLTNGRKVWYEWCVEVYTIKNVEKNNRLKIATSVTHNRHGKYMSMLM